MAAAAMAGTRRLGAWGLASFVAVALLLGGRGVQGQEAVEQEAAEQNAGYELAKQWETYAGDLSEALKAEQSRSQELGKGVESLKLRVATLEALLKEKEDSVNSMARESAKVSSTSVEELQKQLKEAQEKADVAREALEEKVKDLQTRQTSLKERAEEAEKIASEVKELKEKLADETVLKNGKVVEVKQLQAQIVKLQEGTKKAEAEAEEYKRKLEVTEIALAFARESALVAEKDAAAKAVELQKVAGSVLPPWAVARIAALQSRTARQWRTHGEPAVNFALKEAARGGAAVQKWADPYISAMRAAAGQSIQAAADFLQPAKQALQQKVAPVLQKSWNKTATVLRPHVEAAHGHALRGYQAAADFITPHAIKLAKMSEPYVQVVGERVGPHAARVKSALGPHVEAARGVASAYHEHLQERVRTVVQEHGGAISPSLVWHAATVLLVLPLFLVIIISWPVLRGLRKEGEKAAKRTHTVAHKKHRRPRRE